MADNPTTPYKQLKEEFVSNLSGGSISEIAQVLAVAPSVALLWSVLQARQSLFKPYTLLGFVVDFLLNVGSLLLSVTLYASSPAFLNSVLLSAAAFAYVVPTNANRHKKRKLPSDAHSKPTSRLFGPVSTKPFLTNYRGNMMVITCICILAVDFRLFPRRYAKVETWGTSLMDMGVGSFVFSAGTVAARPVLEERAAGKTTRLASRLWQSTRHSLALLVLGTIRLLSVKGLDYAEHVTEYGVHWNFFFTLGFLPPFVAVFRSALKVVPSFAGLAIILSVAYQVLLEGTELKAYILAGPRTNLVSKNREGIFSFFGYLAIFLAGQDAGMFMLPRRSPSNGRRTLLLHMAARATIWTTLYLICTNYSYGIGLMVSRRLANLPYVLWVASFNSLLLFAFCCLDTVFFPTFYSAQDTITEREAHDTATSRVLRSYNRNGLAIFLVANLITGLVNTTVPTLDVGRGATMGILAAYMAILTTAAVGLDLYNISAKP